MKLDHRESRRLNIEKKAIKKIVTTSKNYQKGKRKSMFIFLMKKLVSSQHHIPKPVQDKKIISNLMIYLRIDHLKL